VPDSDICVPPDVMTFSDKCWISYGKTKNDSNECLQQCFIEELSKSTNNCSGCKRYVSGSFIAFPEMFLDNPLVTDSSLIEQNQQVVLCVWGKIIQQLLEYSLVSRFNMFPIWKILS